MKSQTPFRPMRIICLSKWPPIALIVLMLSGVSRPAIAQTSVSPSPRATCTVAPEYVDLAEMPDLDPEAKAIDPKELGNALGGIYKLGDDYAPETEPQLHIGRQSDGKYHVSFNFPSCLDANQVKAYERDVFGAFLAASADSGKGGAIMKAAYDAAPDKVHFSRVLGRAFQLSNEKDVANSDASIAILRALPIGEKRADVYKTLKARSIIVYNFLYSPGVSFANGLGCDPQKTKNLAEFPVFKQPLPKYECGRLRDRKAKAPLSPSASAQFGYGFNLACGFRKDVDLDFDKHDRLKRVAISELRPSCL